MSGRRCKRTRTATPTCSRRSRCGRRSRRSPRHLMRPCSARRWCSDRRSRSSTRRAPPSSSVEVLFGNSLNNFNTSFVDVRDVAAAAAAAIALPEAGGTRTIVTGDEGPMNTLEIGPICQKSFPQYRVGGTARGRWVDDVGGLARRPRAAVCPRAVHTDLHVLERAPQGGARRLAAAACDDGARLGAGDDRRRLGEGAARVRVSYPPFLEHAPA